MKKLQVMVIHTIEFFAFSPVPIVSAILPELEVLAWGDCLPNAPPLLPLECTSDIGATFLEKRVLENSQGSSFVDNSNAKT